eukprot:gene29207-35256_t
MKSKFHAKNNFHQHRALVRSETNLDSCSRGVLYRLCMPMSLLTLLAFGIYYFFYSSHLYAEISSSPSSPQQTINPAKPPSGLYTSSKYVLEVASEAQYYELVSGRSAVVAVYYASWCGHCRAFAPQFMQTSEIATKALSQLQKYDSNVKNISFIAIDCVQHRGICRYNKVDFYPVVIAHYLAMAGCKARECTRLQGAKSDVLKYLSTTVFTHGELDEKFLSSSNNMYTSKMLYMNNDTVAYHLAASSSAPSKKQALAPTAFLLNDIIASYAYFLYNDLPSNIDKPQAALLYLLNNILLYTLPKPGADERYHKQHLQAYQVLLRRVSEVMYKYSAHAQFPSNKVTIALTEPPIPSLPPLLPGSSSFLRQNIRGLASSQLSSPLKWHICGVSVAAAAKPHADPTRGYTCGLWLFFHYLTVHAPSYSYVPQGTDAHMGLYGRYLTYLHNLTMPSIANDSDGLQTVDITLGSHNSSISPSLVQGLVYMYVDRYFRCAECRAHFMHYYNLKLFQPASMRDASAKDVQVWLLLLHNFINLRILYENVYVTRNPNVHTAKLFGSDQDNAGQVNSSSFDSLPTIRRRIVKLADASLWPGVSQCPECYVSDLVAFKSTFIGENGSLFASGLNGYEAIIYDYVMQVILVDGFVKYVNSMYKL